jgi:hypothetical protein
MWLLRWANPEGNGLAEMGFKPAPAVEAQEVHASRALTDIRPRAGSSLPRLGMFSPVEGFCITRRLIITSYLPHIFLTGRRNESGGAAGQAIFTLAGMLRVGGGLLRPGLGPGSFSKPSGRSSGMLIPAISSDIRGTRAPQNAAA